MSIPILKIDHFLIVSVQSELTDSVVLQLQEDLASNIRKNKVHGVVIDITVVDLVDSFIARVLADISKMTSLMGVETVVTGMQPVVAMTLVEMGIFLEDVRTELNLQKGIDALRAIKSED